MQPGYTCGAMAWLLLSAWHIQQGQDLLDECICFNHAVAVQLSSNPRAGTPIESIRDHPNSVAVCAHAVMGIFAQDQLLQLPFAADLHGNIYVSKRPTGAGKGGGAHRHYPASGKAGSAQLGPEWGGCSFALLGSNSWTASGLAS